MFGPFFRRQRFGREAVPASRHLVEESQDSPLIAGDNAHLNTLEQRIREPFIAQLGVGLIGFGDVPEGFGHWVLLQPCFRTPRRQSHSDSPGPPRIPLN